MQTAYITGCEALIHPPGRGHLSHHKNLGRASMGQIFDSDRLELRRIRCAEFTSKALGWFGGFCVLLCRSREVGYTPAQRTSSSTLLHSPQDGDVLFVAHRQPLQGRPFEVDVGGLRFSPSISHNVMTRREEMQGPRSPEEGEKMQGTRLELFSEKLMFKGNNKMYFLLKGQHEEAELFRLAFDCK